MADRVTVTSNGQSQSALLTSGPLSASGQPLGSATNPLITQPVAISTPWRYAAAASGIDNTTTAVTVKAAAAAGVRNYIQSMQISHDALGGATELAIRDGAGGTVLWRGKLQTTATDASGMTINFDPPLQGTAATLAEVVTLTAVTGGVYVNLQGYTGS